MLGGRRHRCGRAHWPTPRQIRGGAARSRLFCCLHARPFAVFFADHSSHQTSHSTAHSTRQLGRVAPCAGAHSGGAPLHQTDCRITGPPAPFSNGTRRADTLTSINRALRDAVHISVRTTVPLYRSPAQARAVRVHRTASRPQPRLQALVAIWRHNSDRGPAIHSFILVFEIAFKVVFTLPTRRRVMNFL